MTTATRPPLDPDVVLPRLYYAILAVELAGLVVLHVRDPEPSGGSPNSYSLGWIGVASMLVMHVYSLRRRVRAFRHLGALRHWLHFHIFCGLQGAMLVAFHSWHTRHVRNLQGWNIIGVGVVVLSGFFGRYLYSFLPRSVEGERLSTVEIDGQLAELERELAARTDSEITVPVLKLQDLDASRSLVGLVGEHVRISVALHRLRRRLRDKADPAITALRRAAEARLFLASRRETLAIAARLFSRWTWFHRPLTFVLLALTVLHVWAHYVYGTR